MHRLYLCLGLASAACGRSHFDAHDARSSVDGADAMADAGISGLVVRYPMDDDPQSGTVTASIAADNGSCTTCPFATVGHAGGGGYSFDGTRSVKLPVTVGALVGAPSFTVSIWVRPIGLGTFVAKPLTPTDVANPLKLYYDGTTLTDETAIAVNQSDFLSVPVTLTGQWHHVAATWDGTTKAIYADGTLLGSSPAIPIDAMSPLLLGEDLDDNVPVDVYTGALDELRIYDRALTASEIAQLATQ